jgi:hypothetical protein
MAVPRSRMSGLVDGESASGLGVAGESVEQVETPDRAGSGGIGLSLPHPHFSGDPPAFPSLPNRF